jgi:hypothetical protein
MCFSSILGGRYGSIEPTSQKSYIHLEYKYALEQNKPLFAVVITDAHLDEKVKTHGLSVIETEHSQKLREFKEIVLSRMVRFWSNPIEIKLAIHEAMREFIDRPEVVGWVPGNEAVNTGPALEEIARLTKENSMLREQLANSSQGTVLYNGLSFAAMYDLLTQVKMDTHSHGTISNALKTVAAIFKEDASVIHAFFLLRTFFIYNDSKYSDLLGSNIIDVLSGYGLIQRYKTDPPTLTDEAENSY